MDATPQQFGDPRTVEITEVNPSHKCSFCHRHELNPTEWGPLLKLDDIITHHFCLLFSSLVEQRGRDDEGIQAFLPADIRREIKRGKRLKCKFCKKNNATIGCGIGKCNISFHYTCGYENGCLNQFLDQYQSYCFKHKPKQEIPKETCEECPICMVDTDKEDAIWPPCCGKQLFHRRCLMYTAQAAGYFFKCPLCNSNSPTFIQAVKANGVYIPEQDAAWELEPNAFQELMSHYSRCDAKLCLCPDGREFTAKRGSRTWEIIRCNACASSATHMKCSGLKIYNWKCGDCKTVFEKSGVKGPDNLEISTSPDNSDAGSTTSASSVESSSEEEIIPDISHVINSHKLSAETRSTLPPVKAQADPTCSNSCSQDAMDESSPPVLPIQNPEIEVKFPHSSARQMTIPNRNVKRDPAMTSALFFSKRNRIRNPNVSIPRETGRQNRYEEQSEMDKLAEKTRFAALQAKMHSLNVERREKKAMDTLAMLKAIGAPSADDVRKLPRIPKIPRDKMTQSAAVTLATLSRTSFDEDRGTAYNSATPPTEKYYNLNPPLDHEVTASHKRQEYTFQKTDEFPKYLRSDLSTPPSMDLGSEYQVKRRDSLVTKSDIQDRLYQMAYGSRVKYQPIEFRDSTATLHSYVLDPHENHFVYGGASKPTPAATVTSDSSTKATRTATVTRDTSKAAPIEVINLDDSEDEVTEVTEDQGDDIILEKVVLRRSSINSGNTFPNSSIVRPKMQLELKGTEERASISTNQVNGSVGSHIGSQNTEEAGASFSADGNELSAGGSNTQQSTMDADSTDGQGSPRGPRKRCVPHDYWFNTNKLHQVHRTNYHGKCGAHRSGGISHSTIYPIELPRVFINGEGQSVQENDVLEVSKRTRLVD